MSRVLALCLLILLASACQLRSTVNVEVAREGSGTLRVALAADRELLDRARGAGADPLGDLAATGRRLAASGWNTEDSAEPDAGRRVALSVPFGSPEEFNAVAGELGAALAAPEVTPLSDLRLVAERDRLVITGVAGLRFTEVVAEQGLAPAAAADLLARNDAVEYLVSVRLPGEIVSTTAPQRDGQVLTWPVRPGEQLRLEAVGTRPPAPRWRPVLPVAVVALGLGGALGVRRRRRRARRS